MSTRSLLDKTFITTFLTGEDQWSSSHGSAKGSEDLAAGILYYGFAYGVRARTCVCLGSGGGFVPRLMRQAQRDLNLENSRTILVDGADQVPPDKKNIWGSPAWAVEGSWHRRNYPDIEMVMNLTERAFHDYFVPNKISIDYLHIDADHHYEGVKLDWDLYSTLVTDDGLITLHDTINYRVPCGVPRLIDEIRADGQYAVVNFPIRYGTALLKKNPPPGSTPPPQYR
jgi:hypothetical protein